jgi:hypothetical protein
MAKNILQRISGLCFRKEHLSHSDLSQIFLKGNKKNSQYSEILHVDEHVFGQAC